jgi:hypothetical protein
VTSWVWLVRMRPADGSVTRTRDRGLPLIAHASLSWPDGRREILAACPAGPRPEPAARRADAALVDTQGPATRAVVQWLKEGREPLFDDPAVQQVLRLLAAWPGGPVSTLTRDTVRYCGAVQVVATAGGTGRSDEAGWPLLLLGAAPVCEVGPGLLATRSRTVHGTQRSEGAPWPAPAG